MQAVALVSARQWGHIFLNLVFSFLFVFVLFFFLFFLHLFFFDCLLLTLGRGCLCWASRRLVSRSTAATRSSYTRHGSVNTCISSPLPPYLLISSSLSLCFIYFSFMSLLDTLILARTTGRSSQPQASLSTATTTLSPTQSYSPLSLALMFLALLIF